MKLKLQDGRSRLLNISPRLANKYLDIDQGDQVVISGQEQQTSKGKTVIIVDGILVLEDSQKLSNL